ncbi:redoxin domain-containing protein [Campylobacter upsaliensis]|uniref:Thioredoxin domain protein n=1 Tax=Campylobacter upsaliensis JV21 TaxID=888826 RepID=A0A828QY22_CAMUP|nr:redoxin domain-containing protein [Campylobacter upsaliensis]EAB5280938.1 TlpA family protein disulfide reductase [Campylobacter upsaliensis]EAH4719852.1 TlpA family protein disulfide reductase [Campylobacter upsaliensis]EAH5199711.1 TlpA family protein disulfide reductase [Campylobacter upsaliensis]EAH5217771.1 TlpA family protein disulfide reductase [Campylobacter upsaliensis]EAH5546131.1 TlpA family protein disulfide reductase [Campylobacter upsaliensis]
MQKIRIIFSAFLIAFLFMACASEDVKNELDFKEFALGEKVLLRSVNGGEKTFLRKEKGFVIEGEEDKILMFDFFGTFCQPCKEEALELSKLWQNNSKHFVIIGLSHFEEVSDEEVLKFAKDYNAFYFLSNSKEKDRLIAQILKDISYQNMELLPFKVVLKDGVYQNVSDFWNKGKKVQFYLGKVPSELIQEDINTILKGTL